MTEKKETELRITFTTMAFNTSSVITAIEEEAFKRGLPSKPHKIGGLLEQTWGVKIIGTKAELDKFDEWFKENATEFCDSTFARMLKGM